MDTQLAAPRPWRYADGHIFGADTKIIANEVDSSEGGLIVRAVNAHDDLVTACKFLMSQVERLAQVYMSEGAEEWILKNDAMNCGRRALDL